MAEPKLTEDGQFMANLGFSVITILVLSNLYDKYGEDIKREVLILLGQK
jgi:hypothetical protein